MKYSINIYNLETSEIIATKGTDFISMGVFLRFIDAFEGMEKKSTSKESVEKIADLVCAAIPTLTKEEAINQCDFGDLMALFTQIVNSAQNIRQPKN